MKEVLRKKWLLKHNDFVDYWLCTGRVIYSVYTGVKPLALQVDLCQQLNITVVLSEVDL